MCKYIAQNGLKTDVVRWMRIGLYCGSPLTVHFSDYYTVLWLSFFSIKLFILKFQDHLNLKNVQTPNLKSEIIAAVLKTNGPRDIKCRIPERCGWLLRKVRSPESALQILTALYLSCIGKHHNCLGFLPHKSAINQAPVELWHHCPLMRVFSIVSGDISETGPNSSQLDTLCDGLSGRKSLNQILNMSHYS